MHVIIYTDGGARGNPGPAGAGAVIYDEAGHQELATVSEYLGEATNNVAEYTAVLMGLQKAKELGATTVHFRMDSQLVQRQMTGAYRVKQPHLQTLFLKIHNLAQQFQKVSYEHVRREKNKRADELANEAMDRGTAHR
ncbi:MAG: ribonuclease HI family protein [Parcubacteria group bacterium]|nr:ribonuclease HI family protein [Parcubacteria group bacterium]